MHTKAHKEMLRLVLLKAGPIATMAAKHIGPGRRPVMVDGQLVEATITTIDTVKLEAELSTVYSVVYEDGNNGRYWCRVWTKAEKPVMVAQGFDTGKDQALLQAVYGAAREEDARKAVSAALATKGIPEDKVDGPLRAELEKRYALAGTNGPATLAKDMLAFDNPK